MSDPSVSEAIVVSRLVDEPESSDVETCPGSRWWWLAWPAVACGIALRTWGLGDQDLTFDEAFTGAAARQPVGEILPYLRNNDTHPPLDYLVRVPFAREGSELALRFPSAVFSVVTLLLIAWWMHRRGAFGAFTTIVASVTPLLIMHGREARMYSLVMLVGVVAAMAGARWLRDSSTAAAVGVAGAGLLAMLGHSATIPAVGAFFLLPGLRRDRAAWVYRGLLVGALGVWGALWGPAFRTQASVVSSFWIPLTTFEWVETVGAALLSFRSSLLHVSFAVLVLGVVALLLRGGPLARVAAVGFVVPFMALAAVGFELHVLLPRSFAFGVWVVPASLGAGIDWIRIRLGERGAVLGVILAAVLLVPSSLDIVQHGREEQPEMDELRNRLGPGDRISISPAWFRPVVQWNFVAKSGFVEIENEADGRFVVADPSAPYSGRTHLLDHRSLPMDGGVVEGVSRCDTDYDGAAWLLRCVSDR